MKFINIIMNCLLILTVVIYKYLDIVYMEMTMQEIRMKFIYIFLFLCIVKFCAKKLEKETQLKNADKISVKRNKVHKNVKRILLVASISVCVVAMIPQNISLDNVEYYIQENDKHFYIQLESMDYKNYSYINVWYDDKKCNIDIKGSYLPCLWYSKSGTVHKQIDKKQDLESINLISGDQKIVLFNKK